MIDFTLAQIVENLLRATWWTVALSLVTFVGGGAVGLVILFLRTSKSTAARIGSTGFIRLFQGTPLLMQMFLAYFGIALLGWNVPAWLAAGTALTLWSAAFLAEIWRGCVESIPKGQWESSASLAMNYIQQMRYVVLPQAFRISIPPTVGFSVQIIKGTSLTSIIGFVELSKASSIISNATLQPLPVYGCAALIYFLLCLPLSRFSQKLERALDAAHQR